MPDVSVFTLLLAPSDGFGSSRIAIDFRQRKVWSSDVLKDFTAFVMTEPAIQGSVIDGHST